MCPERVPELKCIESDDQSKENYDAMKHGDDLYCVLLEKKKVVRCMVDSVTKIGNIVRSFTVVFYGSPVGRMYQGNALDSMFFMKKENADAALQSVLDAENKNGYH